MKKNLTRAKNLFNASAAIVAGILFVIVLALETAAAPGDLDPTFGTGGRVTTAVGTEDRGNAMVLQPDGKIVVGGRTRPGAVRNDYALARYNADGSLDASFGTGGTVITPLNRPTAPEDEIFALALQPDGKIIAVGSARTTGGALISTGIVRYNPNGSLDASFGAGGILQIDRAVDRAVVLQPDGKIVCGGGIGIAVESDFRISRFNTDGSLDVTFGTGGNVSIDFNGSGDGVYALALQPDGKIVAAGRSRLLGDDDNFAVARLNTDGSLDQTFGTGGKAVTDFADNTDLGFAVTLQSDGKIIVSGRVLSQVNIFDFGLVRYNANGTLDTTFGNGGKVTTNFLNGVDVAYAVKVQSNDKIVAAGVSGATSTAFGLVRYNADGSLDVTFGSGGKTETFFNGIDEAHALEIQPDGKIIAAGTANGGAIIGQFALARYLGDAPVAPRNKPFDFDGDGRADISVFRPDNGTWYSNNSQNGFSAAQFGLSTDKIVPADYDGDGKTDIAVYRGGTWYLQRSQGGFTGIAFGTSDDIPVPADFDGDTKSELAVFRPSNGTWYFYNLMTNQTSATAFGQTGDKPVAADYDGDGKADAAVFRNGIWYLQRSTLGFTGISFGEATDKPTPADYDGDGKSDIAVFRPSNGTWYLQRSQAGFAGIQFGLGTDAPVSADYDGDGKADLAVFRDGTWYLQRSQAGFTGVAFGAATDRPVINAFVP